MRSWVLALPIGEEVWAWNEARGDYEPRTILEPYAQRLVAETRRALAHWASVALPGTEPYTPPVITEHERSGARLGSLLDAKIAPTPTGRGVYLLVDWTAEAARDITALKRRHVSIGTLPTYRDGDGAVFAPLIDEMSLTEHPRLKTIGTIQDTLALRLADAPPTRETPMTPEEMMILIEELTTRLAALEQWQATELAKEQAEDAVDPAMVVDAAAMDAADMTPEQQAAAAEDEMVTKLSDRIVAQVTTKLGAMRLGNAPAAQPPIKPPKLTKLEAAKQAGKSGRAAIAASLSTP